MATLKNTNINDTGHLTLPGNTTSGAGTNGALRFNGRDGKIEVYQSQSGGGHWTAMVQPFLSRQIITTGYIHGGYASSVVWDETNRVTFATDTTIDLAGKQERGHNYKDSCHDVNNCWTFGGAANAHCANNNGITAYNHRTENNYTSGYTRTFTWSTNNPGMIQNPEMTKAWITGGNSSQIRYFDMVTQTLGAQQGSSGTSGGTWGIQHENYGIWCENPNQGFKWSSETPYSRGATSPQGDKHQHCMMFKHANMVGGRERNPSTNWRETNFYNDQTKDVIGGKSYYGGEENMIAGQDWGYAVGWYQGNHVVDSAKFVYATRSSARGGSSLNAKGVNGQSSATMSWRD